MAMPSPTVVMPAPTTSKRAPNRKPVALAVVGLALVVVSLPSVIHLIASQAAEAAPTAVTVVDDAAPLESTALTDGLPQPAAVVAPPVRVSIGSIGVSAPVTQLRLEADGRLQPPKDFTSVGWYAGGPEPGAPGAALLTGHVDSYQGPAVFYRMERLKPGDVITVQRDDNTSARFAVTRLESYSKERFPTARVFDGVAASELRLITCGGEFDPVTKSYTRNLVVFARLIQPATPSSVPADALASAGRHQAEE